MEPFAREPLPDFPPFPPPHHPVPLPPGPMPSAAPPPPAVDCKILILNPKQRFVLLLLEGSALFLIMILLTHDNFISCGIS